MDSDENIFAVINQTTGALDVMIFDKECLGLDEEYVRPNTITIKITVILYSLVTHFI